MRVLIRYYRTLRFAGVGRWWAAVGAWRVRFGREPDEGEWPEP